MFRHVFLTVWLCVLWNGVQARTPQDLDGVRKHRDAHATAILAEFSELLAIPNVASDLPNVRRNAEWLQKAFKARGVTTRLLELDGVPPIVLGQLDTPGAKRKLGIYVHYDGQPVEAEGWGSPPWQPTLCTAPREAGGKARALPAAGEAIDPEWRLYARSAGDDKAPLIALLAALDAMHALDLQPTSNLLFFFEGEEEAGSPHLQQFLESHRDELAVDLWLFCDGPVHQSRRALLAFGARGVCGLDITVYGATRELHSGHYGNWAPNPALELARLLASMKDESGRVLIEGFYDSAIALDPAAEAAVEAMPDYDRELRDELGLAQTEGGGASLPVRLLEPSLNIRGLASATAGEHARNVIPATALASLDLRLVRGNQPEAMLDLVEAHVRKQNFHIVREDPDHATRLEYPKIAKIVRHAGYVAASTSMSLPLVQNVIAATERTARGPVVLLPTLGGSLPLYLFTDLLGRPAVVVPIANHDDNQHAANENLRLANLWYGIELMASLLTMP